ncbi:MAG TPA: PAS domain S-box protein [Terracidiphilus sp.]|jgi:PAS domain S-box-containing protein|nr:PAS domain S-box protein [Terracidiphilus sp.]
MRSGLPLKRIFLGYGAAAVLTPLAVLGTSHIPVFRTIPWTLSYLVVALCVAIGGTLPALLSTLASACGIYFLLLAPRQAYSSDLNVFVQIGAFLITAALITYLVRQRSLAMSSLQSSEMHYRSVAETSPDVVVTVDRDSRILSINPSVKAVFGYEPEDLIGKSLTALIPERMRAAHLAGISRHLATGDRHIPWNGVQLPGLRKDGHEVPLEISFSSYGAAENLRFTGFIRDISDRHRTHAALIQSEKLAAVGRLASSIAHEINNPLEAVTNLIYLSRATPDAAKIQEYLELADHELRRVSMIANQTLQFHKQSNTPVQVDCDALASVSLNLFQSRLANRQISLERRGRAKRAARCVAGEIRQVLHNLIANAIDAAPQQGRILIRSRDATARKSGRTGVLLTIADTGPGIPAEIRSCVFEPFFTTKGDGGSGLGLWICSHLVAKNDGILRMRTSQRPGRSGTVFTVFLPDTEKPAEAGA